MEWPVVDSVPRRSLVLYTGASYVGLSGISDLLAGFIQIWGENYSYFQRHKICLHFINPTQFNKTSISFHFHDTTASPFFLEFPWSTFIYQNDNQRLWTHFTNITVILHYFRYQYLFIKMTIENRESILQTCYCDQCFQNKLTVGIASCRILGNDSFSFLSLRSQRAPSKNSPAI